MRGSEGIADQAIRWSARLHAGGLTAAEEAELASWRRAHPDHEHELQIQLAVQQAASALPRGLVQRLYGGELPQRPVPGRRRALRAGALALAAGAAGALAWTLRDHAPPEYFASHTTPKGGREHVTLPDGSELVMNTDTRLDVAFHPDRRLVTLYQGEALFDVRPDPGRAFIVDSALARIRVAGTRFNVRREHEDVQVIVQVGAVQVQSGRWWRRHDTRLEAGQGLHVQADGSQSVPRDINMAADLAWVDGRLVFRDVPLARVAIELNRYLVAPLRLADEQVGRLRLSASFWLDDPEGIVAGLPAVLPVVLARQADGGILVARAPGNV